MANEIKLTKKVETYEDEKTGEEIEYYQLYLHISGVKVKVRPTYKADKKVLVALAEEEND